MDEWRWLIVCTAGLASGAIVGTCLPTETERKVRGTVPRLGLLPWNSLTGLVLNQIIEVVLILLAFTAVGVAILRLGNAHPIVQSDKYILSASWLIGAGVAKWVRYLYWKRRSEWKDP